MRVLVTWGSKRGGTEGIARMVGAVLAEAGHDPVLLPASGARGAQRFDAVIVGGALSASRWHPAARRFVWRQRTALRRIPVWLFSSGPWTSRPTAASCLRRPRSGRSPSWWERRVT